MVRISIVFEHWLEVQLSPAVAALGQALSGRPIRSNWPADYDSPSYPRCSLCLLSFHLGECVISARWFLDGHLLHMTTRYQLAGAAIRPGGRCMRLFGHGPASAILLDLRTISRDLTNSGARTLVSSKLWGVQLRRSSISP